MSHIKLSKLPHSPGTNQNPFSRVPIPASRTFLLLPSLSIPFIKTLTLVNSSHPKSKSKFKHSKMSRASPYFRSPFYGNPARGGAYFPPSPPPAPATGKPRVVSIPVHFVRSEPSPEKRAAAAIKIQKAFRGFLVRKNVGTARGIEVEVDEMEMRFRREEEMERIVSEEKERIKMNEMLMRLLLRLDSVRGVRDYRKKVIRRVIALQEMLDSVAAGMQTLASAADDSGDTREEESEPDAVIEEDETLGSGDRRSDDPTLESAGEDSMEIPREEPMEIPREEPTPDSVIEGVETLETDQVNTMDVSQYNPDASKTLETADLINPMEIPQDSKPDVAIEESKTLETANEINPMETSLENKPDEGETLETAYVISPMEIHIDNKPEESKTLEFPQDDNPNAVSEEAETLEAQDQISNGWEILDTKEDGEESIDIPEAKVTKKDAAQSDGRVKDAMERMAAENEKLKGLVAELCERSAQQCKLMVRLAERVESLEKTVEKMERKSKKKKKDGSILPPTKQLQ